MGNYINNKGRDIPGLFRLHALKSFVFNYYNLIG